MSAPSSVRAIAITAPATALPSDLRVTLPPIVAGFAGIRGAGVLRTALPVALPLVVLVGDASSPRRSHHTRTTATPTRPSARKMRRTRASYTAVRGRTVGAASATAHKGLTLAFVTLHAPRPRPRSVRDRVWRVAVIVDRHPRTPRLRAVFAAT